MKTATTLPPRSEIRVTPDNYLVQKRARGEKFAATEMSQAM